MHKRMKKNNSMIFETKLAMNNFYVTIRSIFNLCLSINTVSGL
jgi:hypothetical protein